MLSKLSEEISQLLKSHMPESSGSGKCVCLHILVQNWNLLLESALGGKQLCLAKLDGYFLFAEASSSLEQRQPLTGNTCSYFLVIPSALKFLDKFRAPGCPGNFLVL